MRACSSENPDEIKRLQREINNITSTLKLYRINVEAWEPLLVYHYSLRPFKYSLQLWEQSVGNKTDILTWKEFINS